MASKKVLEKFFLKKPSQLFYLVQNTDVGHHFFKCFSFIFMQIYLNICIY